MLLFSKFMLLLYKALIKQSLSYAASDYQCDINGVKRTSANKFLTVIWVFVCNYNRSYEQTSFGEAA